MYRGQTVETVKTCKALIDILGSRLITKNNQIDKALMLNIDQSIAAVEMVEMPHLIQTGKQTGIDLPNSY